MLPDSAAERKVCNNEISMALPTLLSSADIKIVDGLDRYCLLFMITGIGYNEHIAPIWEYKEIASCGIVITTKASAK